MMSRESEVTAFHASPVGFPSGPHVEQRNPGDNDVEISSGDAGFCHQQFKSNGLDAA